MAAQSPEANTNELTNAHFDSNILKRIKLHNNDGVWIVPLRTLVGPCFVVYNKDYCDSLNGNTLQFEIIAYIVEPMKKWGDAFLPP